MKFYDYIFFRTYKWYEARDSHPHIFASGIVSVLQGFTLLSGVAIIKIFFSFSLPNKYLLIPICLAVLVYNWNRYERNLDIKYLEARWKEESKEKKARMTLIIISYGVLVISIPIIVGILVNNLGII